MDNLITLVDETCLNTMVIDIKDDQGNITYQMSLSVTLSRLIKFSDTASSFWDTVRSVTFIPEIVSSSYKVFEETSTFLLTVALTSAAS